LAVLHIFFKSKVMNFMKTEPGIYTLLANVRIGDSQWLLNDKNYLLFIIKACLANLFAKHVNIISLIDNHLLKP
jgi:hypothetical protein